MTLGERIVYYREKKGLSQRALAEQMGITATRLNYWEKDKREPDVAMINKLCEILDADANIMVGRTEKSPAPSEDSTGEGKLGRDDVVKVLTALGFIDEGEKLADSDFLFLEGVINILDAWFEQRRQGV